ncbi:MAG TPA: ABC-F family ATP-binding cassette domain-containing protein, partial [Terriglobus sp.]
NKITEVWNKRVWFYTGGYEKYVKQKTERREQLARDYASQHERIEQLEAFIGRFRYQATKAKQVQSRIKELEKIERIEVPEDEETIHFTFPQPPASGRIVCEVSNLSKRYEPKQILSNVNFTIERGDRIALVGPNGAGKSTLIRMLSEMEQPTTGTVRYGHNVLADYFAQDQYKVLDPQAKMLDDISGAAPKVPTVDLRKLLGAFLFSGDDVFKQLGVLSGGERNRYALARMLVSPANFILLDEPTNHLDLRAKDVLLEAIRNFTGTVLFVSHDRYFIDGLATRVFECEHGGVQVYPGNYEDYLWRKSGGPEQMQAAAIELQKAHIPVIETPPPPPPPAPVAANVKKLNPIKLKQMQDRVRFAEEEMPRLEDRMTAIETAMGNFVSAEESQRQTVELAELRKQHESLMLEWEDLSTQLEEQGASV